MVQSQRFNTSHVTLYRITGMLAQLIELSFNTSHVTLYHKTDRTRKCK